MRRSSANNFSDDETSSSDSDDLQAPKSDYGSKKLPIAKIKSPEQPSLGRKRKRNPLDEITPLEDIPTLQKGCGSKGETAAAAAAAPGCSKASTNSGEPKPKKASFAIIRQNNMPKKEDTSKKVLAQPLPSLRSMKEMLMGVGARIIRVTHVGTRAFRRFTEICITYQLQNAYNVVFYGRVVVTIMDMEILKIFKNII